jgi:hypothetical protein
LRCDGEIEIISNKSSRNTYRYNLFEDCKGELVMRGGSHCEVIGNRFENCIGGVRLSGTHHRVMDNVIVDSRKRGIVVLYGMTEGLGGHYQAVHDCLVTNNTIVNAAEIGIHIGSGGGRDWGEKGVASIAPSCNRFAKNIVVGDQGRLVQVEDARENEIADNLFCGTGDAVVPDIAGNEWGDPMFVDPQNGDFRLALEGRKKGVGASAEFFESGP